MVACMAPRGNIGTMCPNICLRDYKSSVRVVSLNHINATFLFSSALQYKIPNEMREIPTDTLGTQCLLSYY
jgi:hypothetical protein